MKRAEEENVMVYAIGLAGGAQRRAGHGGTAAAVPAAAADGAAATAAVAGTVAAAVGGYGGYGGGRATRSISPTKACRRLRPRPAAATSS